LVSENKGKIGLWRHWELLQVIVISLPAKTGLTPQKEIKRKNKG
jgi:hypothetical protein